MPASTPELRHCPACNAPNKPDRVSCYACGGRMDKALANSEGTQTAPCTHCGAPIPLQSVSCPSCRRLCATVASAPSRWGGPGPAARIARLPDGWAWEAQTDGAIRLWRTEWWRRGTRLLPYILLVGVFLSMLIPVGIIKLQSSQSDIDWAVIGILGFPVILFSTIILVIVGMVLLREEIIIAPDSLEMRRRLLGWQSSELATGKALLRIRTEKEVMYRNDLPRQIRTLSVDATAIDIQLTFTSQLDWLGMVGESSDPRTLARDEASMLGQYISSITGWPVVDPNA